MIQAVENYIETLFPQATFGQIAEEDSVMNLNIFDTGNNPFFKDGKTHIFKINLFIRDTSYEVMQKLNEEVGIALNNIYDVDTENIHIVNTKKTSSQEPFRDEKNRYNIQSAFEMLLEEV